ncbi:MAG: hypothetical protein BWK78_02585 [Thiotrichaceae bacterium IS1]|nr:MAG: hypothetical protein BWK78_02585 [Thiotrichaceae bacterium IS1]
MPQLTAIKTADDTVIWMETSDNVNAPLVAVETESVEEGRTSRGGFVDDAVQKLKTVEGTLEGTIRAYLNYTLNAFKQVADANINKVTLEFGVTMSAEGGIPYITQGKAAGNLKVTVECSFPK